MSESGPFSGANDADNQTKFSNSSYSGENADNQTEFSDSSSCGGELLVADDASDEQVYLDPSITASTPSDNSVHNESLPFIDTDNESPSGGKSTPHSPFDNIENTSQAFALLKEMQRELHTTELLLGLTTFQAELQMQETAQQLLRTTQMEQQLEKLKNEVDEYVPKKTRRTVFRGPSAPVQAPRRASTPPVRWRSTVDGTMRWAQSRREARIHLQKELQEKRFKE